MQLVKSMFLQSLISLPVVVIISSGSPPGVIGI